FYSSIICERDTIEEIIDARTSDAISLALRFNAPIFTYKNILDKAGIFLKGSESDQEGYENDILVDQLVVEDESIESNDYKKMSLSDLNTALDEAVASEDYEAAAKIRDEISKRN
ncbi:MAG: bifunctional nuclease family protein, partial [Leeuwenhoekiella sp.]|nr:bifunctional nuclease family protein [Leeuwenhoekiella sp.]